MDCSRGSGEGEKSPTRPRTLQILPGTPTTSNSTHNATRKEPLLGRRRNNLDQLRRSLLNSNASDLPKRCSSAPAIDLTPEESGQRGSPVLSPGLSPLAVNFSARSESPGPVGAVNWGFWRAGDRQSFQPAPVTFGTSVGSRRERHPSNNSVSYPISIPSKRLCDLRRESNPEFAVRSEVAGERNIRSSAQMSSSFDDLELAEIEPNSMEVDRKRAHSLCEPISIATHYFNGTSCSPSPTRVEHQKQCYSPSAHQIVSRNIGYSPSPSPTPSPTRRYATNPLLRSLSPIAVRPLSGIKRKHGGDSDSDSSGMNGGNGASAASTSGLPPLKRMNVSSPFAPVVVDASRSTPDRDWNIRLVPIPVPATLKHSVSGGSLSLDSSSETEGYQTETESTGGGSNQSFQQSLLPSHSNSPNNSPLGANSNSSTSSSEPPLPPPSAFTLSPRPLERRTPLLPVEEETSADAIEEDEQMEEKCATGVTPLAQVAAGSEQ